MLIPLGTEQRATRTAIVTHAIIALCLGAHLAMEILRTVSPDLHEQIWRFGDVGGRDFRWWGLWTSLFLHGDWLHVGGNMLFLWVFGPPVESRYGRPGFLALFLIGGAFSGGVHAAMSIHPAIGASGAISAITGSFLVLFPRTHVRCFWIFTLSVIPVPAWWFIGLAVAWDFLAQTMGAASGIAHLAHLGGYVFGFGLSMGLLWARVFPREPYDLFTIFRQAKRRRSLRAAVNSHSTNRPEAALKRRPREQAMTDAVAAARAQVSERVASGDLDAAVEAYDRLIREHAGTPGALTLARNTQYEVANHLVRLERRREAADAYQRFLDAYPTDREADLVRLMLGRLLGRYLGEDDRARELLGRVIQDVRDEELTELAREELSALGPAEGAS